MDRITELADKVAKLEHLLSRNSGNSSMPPSLDDKPGGTPPKGKGRATPKRAMGKQKGAPAANLSWSDVPDDRKDRFPQGACGCGADLAAAADLGVVDAFQQIEIPTVRDGHPVRPARGPVRQGAHRRPARRRRDLDTFKASVLSDVAAGTVRGARPVHPL